MEINGLEVRIAEQSVEEILSGIKKEAHPQVMKTILATGGALFYHLSQELIDANINSGILTEQKVEEFKNTQPRFEICLITDFVSVLTDEEKEAVIYHELGHITHAHHEIKTVNDLGIIESVEAELQADAYAVEHVSAYHMESGLKKLIRKTFDMIGEYYEKNKISYSSYFLEMEYNKAMNCEVTVRRLEALQKLQ